MSVSRVPNARINEMQRQLAKLLKVRLLVGIPGDAPTRQPEPGEKTPPSNAVLGYLAEFGEPSKNIPARPFLLPGFASVKAQVADQMARAGAVVLAGGPISAAMPRLEDAGIIAREAVVQKIKDGPFTPLSEKTIKARARRKTAPGGRMSMARAAKEARKYLALQAQGVPVDVLNDPALGLATPLIDSGQMQRSVTYIVKTG